MVGVGGRIISVRMRLYCGSERRRSARSWPMKPAAPVIKMFGILDEIVVEKDYSRRYNKEGK